MAFYEITLLGGDPTVITRLVTTINEMVAAFGFTPGVEFVVRDANSTVPRNRRAAQACAFFEDAKNDAASTALALELLKEGVPTIPILSAGSDWSALPTQMQGLNGMFLDAGDPDHVVLAAALLECVGLLRRQRRVFVSYRRTESRHAAVQLHDLLSERAFDVFLDTHNVRPGDPFQDILWHRLVDSDVVVMLDTPGYFDSTWTRQELARARARDIHILRIVWPGHTPTRHLDIADGVHLTPDDLTRTGTLKANVARDIAGKVESIRSRSIGARYLAIAGKFRAEIEKIGASFEGVGANRALSILLNGKRIWAYPVVGIPTAEVLNEIADNADRAQQEGRSIVIYEHLGIRDAYMQHIAWLEANPRSLKTVKVREADWELSGWD